MFRERNQATNALNFHRLPLSVPAFPNINILYIVLFILYTVLFISEADELRFKSIILSSIHFFSLCPKGFDKHLVFRIHY